IRLQDKYTRCCNLIRGKEQMVKDEALEDTLLDLANYAVIVLCLRRAEQSQEQDGYTDEEPEGNLRLNDYVYRPNNCTPSDMPFYSQIPVTEEEDEAFKEKDFGC
ncbi:MAG: hypothetical protein ACLFMQ_01615, partial [Desulfohalobiaceae bacterium]